MKKARFFLIAAVFSLCTVRAQTTTGDILGTLRDQSGAVLPGVTVTVTNMDTGANQETVTDEGGDYIFPRLRPGRYRVNAQLSGFKQRTVSEIVLLVDQRPRVDLVLEVGEISTDTVTVEGGTVLLESERANLGQVIEEKRIRDLPLNGRNFMQLAHISAGVIPIGIGASPVTSWTGRADQSASISGGRENSNSFLVDGIESRNKRFGSTGIRPSVDAIQEFKVHRNTFSAEYGNAAAIINTTVKSGSNELHGTVFHFLRNDNLDARNFFDIGRAPAPTPLPEFKQNNFGLALGGPIIKQKLFYFGNYEGFRQRRAREARNLYPDSKLLQGDFSELSVQIIDPFTNSPFPNNRIPKERFSRVAQNLIQFIPLPNVPFNAVQNFNRLDTLSNKNDWDQFHIRVDQVLSETDSLFYRYSFSNEEIFFPQVAKLRGEKFPQKDQNAVISETHIFSPSLINEWRLGWNRSTTFRVSEGSFGENIAARVGIKNATQNAFSYGIPNVVLMQFSGIGSIPQSIGAIDQVFQLTDHLSWRRGQHNFKLGADGRRTHYFQDTNFAGNPSFTFSGVFGCGPEGPRIIGCAVADFLLGVPVTVSASVGDSRQYLRNIAVGAYFQDDWKVNPRLTINWGIRYEVDSAPIDLQDRMKFFDAASGTVKVVGKDPGVRRSIVANDLNNWAPRLGLAYRLTKRTVVRAGVGVYYDTVNWNEQQFHVIGPPFFQSISLNSRQTQPDFLLDEMLPDLQFNPGLTFPFSLDPNNRTPYYHQYSLNIQHQLTSDLLVEIGYAGSSGHKLGQRLNLNQGRVDPTGTIPLSQRVRYPQFSAILWTYNGGNSNYNEGTLRVEKRFSHGLSLLANYTFSKSIDSGHTDEFAGNIFNLRGDRGPSTFDATHRFVASYIYDLPFGVRQRFLSGSTGVVNHLVSGWQVNGITTFMSGQPRNIGFIGRPPVVGPFSNVRADRVGSGDCKECRDNIRKNPVPGPYFRTEDFKRPADFTFGNAGRNVLRAPGVNNWDLSVFKNNFIRENFNVQFRAEFFNAFNHAQFTGINTTVGSPTYGRVTGAREGRDIQLAVRVVF